jgi:hypothetical protein
MPLSPLSESESPLHNNTNEDTFINPFEISDDIPSTDQNITIEPDDVGLSTDSKSQPKPKSQTLKATATINVEQTSTSVSGSIGQQTRSYASDTLDEPVSVTIVS